MNRTLLIAAGALILAGIAVFYVYQTAYIDEETGGERILVVVAARDIPFGEPMQSSWLGTRELPVQYVEDRHLRASDLRRLIGVPLAQSVHAGEAVLRTDLSVFSDLERTLSGAIPAGKRAIAIEARPESAHAGLLRPGDRVDVLLTVGEVRRPGSGRTVVVAQNLLVLSVGHTLVNRWDDDRHRATQAYNTQVNLEVGLEDAQRLTLARRQGQMRVILRNPNDASIVEDPNELEEADLMRHETREGWLRRFALVERPEPEPDPAAEPDAE